ncbi:MAG: DUF58 domain-containing protein [Clostridia bacterium]|nr:DUF58 domain-containing protein [Clostridia bacterium]
MNGAVLIVTLLILMLLQHELLKHFGMRGLKYTRHFARKTAFEGEETELVEIIRNDRPIFIPWLRAESRISPHLRFGKQENLSVSGERFHRSIFTLRPYQQITRRHIVRLMHRGAYDAGNVALTIGDIAGLGGGGLQLYTPAEILVYPRLLADRDLPLPVSRLQGDLIVRRHMVTDPFLVNGIRPYQRGDQQRDIHWPATARMGNLQVKTHDYTADTKLLVIINAQMSEKQWGDLMDYEQDVIENAISIAATLCLKVLQGGVAAGFAANMPLGKENDSTTLLPPERHATRDEELLSAFARLEIKRTRNFLSFLEDLSFLRGTDILLLSAYTSEGMEEKLQQLRMLGNTVTLHLLGKGAGK